MFNSSVSGGTLLLATRDPKRYSTTIRIGPLERFANGRSALFGSRSVILLSPCLIFRARSSLIQRRPTLPESILATIWCSGRARQAPEPSSAVARAHRRLTQRGKAHAANFGSTGDVTIPDGLGRRRSAVLLYPYRLEQQKVRAIGSLAFSGQRFPGRDLRLRTA